MKKVLFMMMMLLPMMASAEYVEIDGIYYNLISKGNAAEVAISGTGKYIGAVSIPATISYNGADYNVTKIGDRAFYECVDLSSVDIPTSVVAIGDKTFYNCVGLSSLTMPSSIKSIGEHAFEWCIGLTSVVISDLTAWCNISFADSESNPLQYAHHLYLGDTEIKDLVIPSSITAIGDYSFDKCYGLTSLTIHNQVTSIGKGAFHECIGLTSANIPNSVKNLGIGAFQDCRQLSSISIPNSISTISNYAFSCCGLTNFDIPHSVSYIGDYAFSSCKFTTLNIPNSVTYISDGAFQYCTQLTDVNTGSGVTWIGKRAFEECSSLKKVTFGSIVTWIGRLAFASCEKLENVYCLANQVPGSDSEAFSGSYIEYAILHVPASSIESYKAAIPWKNFKDIVAYDPSGIQGIILDKTANAPVYDLNGRRLKEPNKGINIIGGKKIVVK